MNSCSLLAFDLGGCLGGLLFWWVPLVPWWAWLLAGLALVGVVWKFAGWPGLIALAAAVGFWFGRRSTIENDEIWPSPDKPVKKRPKAKPATKRPSDAFKDWISGEGD